MTTPMEVDSVPGVVTERDLSFGNTLLTGISFRAGNDEVQGRSNGVRNRQSLEKSSRNNDDFGGARPTAGDARKATQPLGLEGAEKKGENDEGGLKQFREDEDPLLQGHGATHMFKDMHGFSTGVEDIQVPYDNSSPTNLRHMAGLTMGGPKSTGNTDWEAGTDGGRSSKPQDGVPYGSFTGV